MEIVRHRWGRRSLPKIEKGEINITTYKINIALSLAVRVVITPVLAQEKTNDFPVLKAPYLGQKHVEWEEVGGFPRFLMSGIAAAGIIDIFNDSST